MKTYFIFSLAILSSMAASAQQYVADLRTGSTNCTRLTINIQNEIAYVSRQNLPFNLSTPSKVQNFSDVGIVNGQFSVPTNGATYWVIPVLEGAALQANGGNYCISCVCPGEGQCSLSPENACVGNCNVGCTTILKRCDSAASFQGSFVLVKAKQVVFN